MGEWGPYSPWATLSLLTDRNSKSNKVLSMNPVGFVPSGIKVERSKLT